jgi:hypothetical protein
MMATRKTALTLASITRLAAIGAITLPAVLTGLAGAPAPWSGAAAAQSVVVTASAAQHGAVAASPADPPWTR